MGMWIKDFVLELNMRTELEVYFIFLPGSRLANLTQGVHPFCQLSAVCAFDFVAPTSPNPAQKLKWVGEML